MRYRQKSRLDADALRPPLSRLLGWEARQIRPHFESRGSSGNVFRVAVTDSADHSADLLLKKEPDPNAWRFHRDVLARYELNSPRMLGVLRMEDTGDEPWLVMEYCPHEPPDWADPQRYRRAVDWLIHKDAVARRNLPRLRELNYLEPFETGDPEQRVEAIARSCNVHVGSVSTSGWRGLLECQASRMGDLTAQLRRGPQTVTHNDYQMLNILFGAGPRAGELFVVDWTYPAIGSVCVDLAMLVHVAPADLRAQIVEHYRRSASFEPFEPIFSAARTHVNLSVLTWMVEAIAEGQSHAVHRPKLREIVSELRRDLDIWANV